MSNTSKDTVSFWKKISFIIPGIKHLIHRDFINGFFLLFYVFLLLVSFLSAYPRFDELLILPSDKTNFKWHPWFALLSFIVIALSLWHISYHYKRNTSNNKNKSFIDMKKQFNKNRVGLLGFHGVNILLFITLLAPFITPFNPDVIDIGPHSIPPNWEFLMGTDEFGRDIFSRVLYGSRISLSIGFIAVFISISIGVFIGSIAGYFGGVIDHALMWVVDLLLSLPHLVLLLAIVGFFRTVGVQSLFLIVIVLGFTGWMGVSRIVRSSILSLKEMDFIQAGLALGFSDFRIIFFHLLPNVIAPVIVHASLAIGATILTEAALSFLGLGVPPPTATWGSIINDGREYMRIAPWITIFPGMMVILSVMSFNLLGDGLRDALDPKLRGRS